VTPPPTKRSRLGWLGPAIALLGIAVGGLAVWFMISAKPTPGVIVDTIVIDDTAKFVVKTVAGDPEKNFVELHANNEVRWQALVPKYAGAPGRRGIAWNKGAAIVRVIRNNRAEVFALSMVNAKKLGGFRLAPNHGEIVADDGPIIVDDHIRAYQIVRGPDWIQLVGIDIDTGKGLWRAELGTTPVTEAGVRGGEVWVKQGALERKFHVFNGLETTIRRDL